MYVSLLEATAVIVVIVVVDVVDNVDVVSLLVFPDPLRCGHCMNAKASGLLLSCFFGQNCNLFIYFKCEPFA